MNYDEAIEKAAKLLRLANGAGATPAEAALAAARAQEIMDKFQIESAVAEYARNGEAQKPDEPIKNFGDDMVDGGGAQLATWKTRLISAVARANGCRVFLTAKRDYGAGGVWERRKGYGLVGRASDVSTVRYFYAFLERQVEALAARDCPGYGRNYALNYRCGVVETVQKRLQEQHAETQRAALVTARATGNEIILAHTQSALAKIERRGNEVDMWMAGNMKLRHSSGSSFGYNDNARQRGREAGREIRFGAARGSLCAA